MSKLYIIICIVIFPLLGFSQYKLTELPTVTNIPQMKKSESIHEFRIKWLSIGKLNSTMSRVVQTDLKVVALEIYDDVNAEKKKAKPNKKLLVREIRRYKLYQSMVKRLDIIINKKIEMERLCFNYHKDSKTAQNLLFRQVQKDSKTFSVYYIESKALED